MTETDPDGESDCTRYAVTYAFNGYLRGEYVEAVQRIRDTEAQLQQEGIPIDFQGATQRINGSGQMVAMTAHFVAPSDRAVTQLNRRARLPASDSPVPAPPDASDTESSTADH